MLLKWIFIDGWFIWATLAGIWLIWYIFKGIRFGFVFINDNNKKKEGFLWGELKNHTKKKKVTTKNVL